ncbi:MAG: M14 family zinc carboxypeptidase [Chloroflexota bacterium]
MKKIFTLFFILSLTLLLHAQTEKYSRIKIHVQPTELRAIAKLGIPPDAGYYDFKQNYFVAELTQREISKLKSLGFSTELLVDDVSKWYVERNENTSLEQIMKNAKLEPSDYPVPEDFELGSCGGFCTIDECYAHLDNMFLLYPELITQKMPISDLVTVQNRPIYYVKLSDNPNENEDEPQVLYTGMHHAREGIGMQVQLYFMYYLLENYATNKEVQDLVNNTEMYFVPIFNVDGYARNIQTNPSGGGMWRKNRRPNGDGSYGVDINRNYGFYWGYDDEGSSPYPSDDTYRGPDAFSEMETQMMKEFCESHNFKIAINFHSYSNLFLYAWGYTPEPSPDENIFSEYSRNMTADNHYTYGPGSTTIYPTNGGSDDWMYGEQTTKNKILSWTPEIGSEGDNFWPLTSRIIPLCQENILLSILAARYSGTFGQIIDQTPLIVPERNYYAIFDVKRFGQTPANYKVYIEPLGDEFESVGDTVTVSGLSVFATKTDSIPFVLKSSVKSSDTIRFVYVLNDGFVTYRDTVEKYFGTPVLLFSDQLTTAVNWTGQWALSNMFPWSAPSSMADSPTGNYNNNANKSTTLVEPVVLTNASVAVLNFYAKWNIEAGYDYVQVSISTNNGSTWTPLAGKYTRPGTANQAYMQPVYDDRSGWVKEEINISQYTDESIKLKFTLRSDNYTTFDGYYFDDVTINMIDRTVNTNDLDVSSTLPYLSEGYPNPSNDVVKFNYSLKKSTTNGRILVSDISGRVLKTITLQANENQVSLNLGELKPGIYMCTLKSNEGSVSRKVSVVK